MSVYLINSYDIDSMEEFRKYPPKARLLIEKYGGKVLASDISGVALEGKMKTMNAIIEFPTAEAATNCYNDPDYKSAKEIRIGSTSNCTMVLVKQFES